MRNKGVESNFKVLFFANGLGFHLDDDMWLLTEWEDQTKRYLA